MNKFKTAMMSAALAGCMAIPSVSAGENSASFVAVDDEFATQLCVMVAKGNNIAMYAKIRARGFSMAYVRNFIRCNDESIGSFAARYGNKRVRFLLPPAGKVTIKDIG